MAINKSKIKLRHVLLLVILVIVLILFFLIFRPILGAVKESPNMIIDGEGNLHIVWVSGLESFYEQDLYYKKISPDGKTIIDSKKLSKIERNIDGTPEITIDSMGNLHIFTGHEISTGEGGGMMIQYLIVNDGEVILEKEIKEGYETRYPVVAIDEDDNIFFLYSVWNQRENKESRVGWSWDIRYYLEKINSEGETIMSPAEIKNFSFPDADDVANPIYGRKIFLDNDKLYFATRLTYYGNTFEETKYEYKYIELDENGELLRILNSQVEYFHQQLSGERLLPILVENDLCFCFENNCVVNSQGNIYYFYPYVEKRGDRRIYLKYKEINQLGEVVKEDVITKFAKGPFFWVFDPVIFDIRTYIDNNNDSNIIYYINDGFNNLSVFYSKISSEGKILVESLKIR